MHTQRKRIYLCSAHLNICTCVSVTTDEEREILSPVFKIHSNCAAAAAAAADALVARDKLELSIVPMTTIAEER